MKRNEKTLTKVEFDVMTILWDLGRPACAWDIVNEWKEPKPAYTTIATYLRVLYEKGFVEFKKSKGEGKTHLYIPIVSRAQYTYKTMQEVKKNFFGGSLKSMLCYFIKEENLSQEEIQQLLLSLGEESIIQ
ncbi:MAG: BlaI/MecI/CopY family transcriptional regulator [Bacteroidaceae bacterium]|nr:BlaI/MecI/CopY family transcriptional regulator [Bacteroidaceae bacterium]